MSDLISKKEATTIPVMPVEHREYQTMNLDDAYEQGWYDLQKCIEKLSSAEPEIIRCKDCKHFEYDHIENVNGIPLIVAHEICMRWGEGSKTSENGYCFLAERKEE